MEEEGQKVEASTEAKKYPKALTALQAFLNSEKYVLFLDWLSRGVTENDMTITEEGNCLVNIPKSFLPKGFNDFEFSVELFSQDMDFVRDKKFDLVLCALTGSLRTTFYRDFSPDSMGINQSVQMPSSFFRLKATMLRWNQSGGMSATAGTSLILVNRRSSSAEVKPTEVASVRAQFSHATSIAQRSGAKTLLAPVSVTEHPKSANGRTPVVRTPNLTIHSI
mgnify:CR=1 FL=1|jgi:hypothetical protein